MHISTKAEYFIEKSNLIIECAIVSSLQRLCIGFPARMEQKTCFGVLNTELQQCSRELELLLRLIHSAMVVRNGSCPAHA